MLNWRIQRFFFFFFPHLHPTLKGQMEQILGLTRPCGKVRVGSEVRTSDGQPVHVRRLGDKVSAGEMKRFGLIQEKAQ